MIHIPMLQSHYTYLIEAVNIMCVLKSRASHFAYAVNIMCVLKSRASHFAYTQLIYFLTMLQQT